MYNLIECSENYANTSGSLWQCCRDKPNKDIANSESFKFESALANNTDNAGREKTLTIDDTKLQVPVATLSTQDNAKLLQQLKPGFKRTINWNKYKSWMTKQTRKL